MQRKYNILTFIAAIIICLAVISLHLLSYGKTKSIFMEHTKNIVVDMKKDFLKDTVNNVFLEIDMLREARYESYRRNTEVRKRRIEEELYLPKEEFAGFFIDRFEEDINSHLWTPFLWNKETEEVLYDPLGLYTESIDSTLENLKSSLSTYVVIDKDNLQGVFGVSKEYIDIVIKSEIGDVIRQRRFSNNSYIWVNEVLNYEGGENYAIRRIHPNQVDSEGVYLSTNIEDIKGNKPYLEELEGINKDGELFFTYYFKELNSDEISEKLTYARHYKDYNWIIAMGVHLTDIDNYTESINNETLSLTNVAAIRLLFHILLLILLGFLLFYLIYKRRLSNSTRSFEKEINMDVLTSAFSRRYGIKILNSYYRKYKMTGENLSIMMFDIDNFKNINDTFGHNTGDIVLIETVQAVKGFVRSSDSIIRWGGDEFICIFPGLKLENAIGYGEKILEMISLLEVNDLGNKINFTISIGFSCFSEEDHDYNDVLKRVDEALYKSKKIGKNNVTTLT